jgi:hypothetical protein
VNHAGRVVRLLAAQAFVFGLSASLLVIASSAIFLAAYGSRWLPLTFIAIALFGTLVAAWIARVVRHRPLPHVAILVESVVGLLFFGAWAVLTLWSGVWVSAPLLVLFPILLQVGFVFVGGQAGRLLDLQQMKIHFPRIVFGFAVGFLAGGLVAMPLLSLPGGTNGLFLIAAIAQVAFVVLLTVTAGRFTERLGKVERTPHGLPRPPLHRLLSSRFVLLLMAYQVLSAAGTYMAEYILFDRAAARFGSADSLAQFLSRFTIALNAVSLVFLALLAAPLLRRFGLRLGIVANPAVVLVFAVAMLVSATSAGAESLALFAIVASARIADVTLTDGVTRASLNTSFQALPIVDRLAVQSVVEGAGLPMAIGVTGVALFALRTAGASVAVIIAVTVVVCVAWTAAAVLLYRDYARALVVALRQRLLRDAPVDVEDAETAAFLHELLRSDDGRDVRLALDLLPSASAASGEYGELALLADDPRPDLRLPALVRLAEAGDGEPQGRIRETRRTLLSDADPAMRTEALAAIGPADVDLVDEVVAALEVPATMSAAAAALGRLGDAALPRIAAALAETSEQPTPATLRLVRATKAASPDQATTCLRSYIEHRDRELGLAVLIALAAAGADPAPIAATLDRTLRADAEHFARCAAVRQVVGAGSELARALGDELELLRQRVLALLAVRYGAEEIGAVAHGLDSETDDRRSLAAETLDVTLTPADAVLALPLLRTDLPLALRLQQLATVAPVTPTDRAAVLEDILSDGEGHWRSAWLQACAAYESGLVVPA